MKRILKIGAIAVAILFVILVALPLLINANSFRPKIESELTERAGATGDGGQSESVNSFPQRRGREHSHRGRSRLRQAALHYGEVA